MGKTLLVDTIPHLIGGRFSHNAWVALVVGVINTRLTIGAHHIGNASAACRGRIKTSLCAAFVTGTWVTAVARVIGTNEVVRAFSTGIVIALYRLGEHTDARTVGAARGSRSAELAQVWIA